jgi:hypothetical protein
VREIAKAEARCKQSEHQEKSCSREYYEWLSVIDASQDPLPSTVISLSGYMPRRQEFEIEWDNSCEQRVMDIEFTESDTEEDFELKMQLLEMYNERLSKRHTVRQ